MNGRQKCVSFNIPRVGKNSWMGLFPSWAYMYAKILAKRTVTKVSKELSASSKYHPSARDCRQRDDARVCSPVCDFHLAARRHRLVHIFVHIFHSSRLVNNIYIYSFSTNPNRLTRCQLVRGGKVKEI